MPLLQVDQLRKSFRGVQALDEVSFQIPEGSVTGLIGPNGSGKSTLFNVLMNALTKDGGRIYFQGQDISRLPTHAIARLGIARTFQDSKPLPQITVRENLDAAFRYRHRISLSNILWRKKALLEEEKSHTQQIAGLLAKVNLAEKQEVLAKDLSYGQGKLLEILKIMAADPRLILLDEPFSGLFPEMITLLTGLIQELVQKGKTIILIEHNMHLISTLCDQVIVLDAGKKIAEGSFQEVTKDLTVIESYLGK